MNEVSVMVSGGIDSLVAYHLAKTRFGKVTPVFVDVGQPYVEPERELCRKFYGDQLVEFSANMCSPTFGNLPTISSQEIYERNLKTMEKSKKHVEIDFVANQGDRKYYIQSALTINDTEKRAIEARPLNNIDDFFKRIIVTGDLMLPGREENGIVIMNILDFLLNEDSLDREMS